MRLSSLTQKPRKNDFIKDYFGKFLSIMHMLWTCASFLSNNWCMGKFGYFSVTQIQGFGFDFDPIKILLNGLVYAAQVGDKTGGVSYHTAGINKDILKIAEIHVDIARIVTTFFDKRILTN